MLKRLKIYTVAAMVTVSMAATASAAPVIDFSTGPAGGGGNITEVGGNIIGTNIPIGFATFFDTSVSEAPFNVFGDATGTGVGNFGSLNFNTGTGDISIHGCIPGIGLGDAECEDPFELLSGTITGFSNVFGTGLFITSGSDTKNAEMLQLVGLPADLQFSLFGSFSLAQGSTAGNGSPAVSTDIRNTAVPEPATMMLLGTGLLAAFRARRRQA